MKFKRLLAASTALGLLGVVGTAGFAGAQEPAVGTSKASSTIVSIDLGDALKLRVGGDDAQSTTDPQVGPAGAFSRLVGLQAESSLLPALNLSIPDPAIESRTPGGQSEAALADVNLNTALSAIPGIALPASVASGSIDATLRSALDGSAARSSMDAAISNLSLAGGLLSAGDLASRLATGSSAEQADGTRAVEVGTINVLDLGAMLDGLGLTLADLPIATISQLLSSLGVPVAGIPQGTDLAAYVTALNAAINEVQSTIDQSSQTVTSTVDSTVGGLLGSLALPVPTTQSTVTQVMRTVDGLQATLTGVITTALDALDGLTLLRLDGANVGIATKAARTVGDSVADVTAQVGGVTIGGISLPGVDLSAAASQVNGLVGTVNSTLSGALGTIHPSLGSLVSVSVLDQVESITADNGYVRSRAGITALTATITPPAELGAIVSAIKSATGAGNVLKGLGAPVPGLSDTMSGLESTLGGALQALAGGAVLKVADVQAASDFSAPGGPLPANELPRTGGFPLLAGMAGMLIVLALGTRRLVASTSR